MSPAEPNIRIQPLTSASDLLRSLTDFCPNYIIMYDYDIRFIRQVEVGVDNFESILKASHLILIFLGLQSG